MATGLLNILYPTKTITMSSRDPAFITARIKGMLRHKNRLMRAGRLEEASAVAKRVGTSRCLTTYFYICDLYMRRKKLFD